MRHGTSIYERCRGISDVCNSKWFSRMWTAMELTQSRSLLIMLKDYTIVENRDPLYPFIYELRPVWDDEVEKQGNIHQVERMIGMGNNLVPWQLCFFENIRDRNLHGRRISFGEAHEFLARRCTTVPRDFFHALLGILQIDINYAQLGGDLQQAMSQIAKECMRKGDYSPLFMIPASVQREPDEVTVRSTGYLDIVTFALGPEHEPGTSIIRIPYDNPIFEAEAVGLVEQITQIDWILEEQRSLWRAFTILCKLALDLTSLDVDNFVVTISVRLYGQNSSRVFNLLSQEDRREQIRNDLSTLFKTSLDDAEDIAVRIADVLGLSNCDLRASPGSFITPMQYLGTHGGSLHLGNAGAIVNVKCYRCQRSFLIRVALLMPAPMLLGAKVYRIPGLKYRDAQAGGVGFLHRNKHIVGRFLWGFPTCDCPKLETVEVQMDDLPLPRANTCDYGLTSETEWFPLVLGNTLRSYEGGTGAPDVLGYHQPE